MTPEKCVNQLLDGDVNIIPYRALMLDKSANMISFIIIFINCSIMHHLMRSIVI